MWRFTNYRSRFIPEYYRRKTSNIHISTSRFVSRSAFIRQLIPPLYWGIKQRKCHSSGHLLCYGRWDGQLTIRYSLRSVLKSMLFDCDIQPCRIVCNNHIVNKAAGIHLSNRIVGETFVVFQLYLSTLKNRPSHAPLTEIRLCATGIQGNYELSAYRPLMCFIELPMFYVSQNIGIFVE